MWKLRYYRYGTLEEYEDETKEDVLSFGVWQSEDGQLSMFELVNPNGEVVMSAEELKNYWFAYKF